MSIREALMPGVTAARADYNAIYELNQELLKKHQERGATLPDEYGHVRHKINVLGKMTSDMEAFFMPSVNPAELIETCLLIMRRAEYNLYRV